MATFRTSFLFLSFVLIATLLSHAADDKATPPVAAPAFLDVVSFEFNADSASHKVIVTSSPDLLRLDEATDGYSVIYDWKTDHYTGLEHRNYTYWEFSWPEVRTAVESSKRHEARLQELGNEGLNGDSATDIGTITTTNAPPLSASSSSASDDSGYVWHPTEERKRIGDYDCVKWVGDTVSGEAVEAWCYAGTLPKVQTAIDRIRAIDEPMALVPVRNITPDFIFPVYAALLKGGVTPLLITWGDGRDKNYFRFLEAKTRNGTLSLFTVPKLYMKTTLITMDGMTDKQPALAPTKSAVKKTWQTQ
jgi:hypothetical protein